MKTEDFTNEKEYPQPFVMYKSSCDCLDDNHNINLIIEEEEIIEGEKELTLSLYETMELAGQYYRYENIFKKLWFRFKTAAKVLFGIPVEYEAYFLMREEQHITDFIKALIEGLEKVQKVRKQK
jgi:hypothetical protein